MISISNSSTPNIDDVDKRVIAAAWDAAIFRHPEIPGYHFFPPGPSDDVIAQRLGVHHIPYNPILILIHLPFQE